MIVEIRWTLTLSVQFLMIMKTMIGSSLPPVVCRMFDVLFTLSVFVCLQWCPIHIVLCFSFVFLRLVYHILPVSLDCPFLIASSVFSNLYLAKIYIVCAKRQTKWIRYKFHKLSSTCNINYTWVRAYQVQNNQSQLLIETSNVLKISKE